MANEKIITTKKFKDVLISLRFASEDLSKKTERSLIALMISDRSEKYYSKEKVNEKLDNMFGANLSFAIKDYGKAHVLELSLSVLNEQFVKSDLLEDQIAFLSQLVYKPLLTKEVFLEAKQVLKDILNREGDNLNSYSVKKGIQLAGEGFPLAYNRIGSLEALEKVSLADIKEEYNKIINENLLNIIVIGDVEKDKTRILLKDYFKESKPKKINSNYLITTSDIKEKTEYKDSQQAYLTIVYNTHTLNVKKDYWTLQLMSMMLGQLPNSLLFLEVREKRSLCYSIRASVKGYDGIMYISSGVEKDSIEEAIEVSKKQVLRMQKGDFSEQLFLSAKSLLIDSIYQSEDSNKRMVDSEYRKIILNKDYNSEDLISLIKKITIKEIKEVAQKLQLNTVYKIVRNK